MSNEPEVKYRDAVSGEYVTAEYAAANPDTTVREEDPSETETWDPAPPLEQP